MYSQVLKLFLKKKKNILKNAYGFGKFNITEKNINLSAIENKTLRISK